MGGDVKMMSYIIWPTLIGGFVGAIIIWAGNKDMSVSIENEKLILKKNVTEIKEYSKDQINTYRVSKDQGKTVIRVQGNNKSEYEMASYMLDLNGFDEAMNQFIN
jgi:hydrogenase maturation factor